jgi:hypothetical protein
VGFSRRLKSTSFASVLSPIRARNKCTSIFGVIQGIRGSRGILESASGTSAYNKAEPALQHQKSIAECFPRNHVHFSAMASQQAYRKQRALRRREIVCRSSHTIPLPSHASPPGFGGFCWGFAGGPVLWSFIRSRSSIYPPEDTARPCAREAGSRMHCTGPQQDSTYIGD